MSVVPDQSVSQLTLDQVRFCVIDLETTGATPLSAAITEVGAVIYQGGQEVDRFQTLINPERLIPASIVMLTGISNSMVADAPKIADVLNELVAFIGTSVVVAHNARFDLGFINAALLNNDHQHLTNEVVDTVALARRLVRNEVPNCKLRTLAFSLRLDHQPSHRAINDVLATGDLLYFLIERASRFGVNTLSELVALTTMSAHPEAKKLPLTDDLPRGPGVYMFLDADGEVLYIGKAANIRQRVRSYFGMNDSRKKVGSLLRLLKSIRYIETPDAVTAEILEIRMIGGLRPRYNHVGTRQEKYCYVRLTTHEEWPRLVITKTVSAKGMYIGPMRSRSTAREFIDAIESVVPLRRCTVRMGKNYSAPPDASACSAARLGFAFCPCSGSADPARYVEVVQLVVDTLEQRTQLVNERLQMKMGEHSTHQRFEEASLVRDRIECLSTTLFRHQQATSLRAQSELVLQTEGIEYHVSRGVLVKTIKDGEVFSPVVNDSKKETTNSDLLEFQEQISAHLSPPVCGDTIDEVILSREIDENLCLARLRDSLLQ